jgi:hypothetical protein
MKVLFIHQRLIHLSGQMRKFIFVLSGIFIAGTLLAAGPAAVNLGIAGNYVILSKSGISTVPPSSIFGDIGVSPIAATGITGFSLILDGSGTFSTSSQVTGKLYAANYSFPTPATLTVAVNDMEAAYIDAAGRPTPDFVELAGGDISGLTLIPGLYKWSTGVSISSNVTLNGGPNDVWIFQISGGITMASGIKVILAGGAKAKNIFWQTFGAVTLGTAAHFEGIVLSYTEITLATGATANGHLYSQTAVTLDSSTVIQPDPPTPGWIKAISISTNQIDLIWQRTENTTSYTLYKNTVNNSGTASVLAGTADPITNFSNTGLPTNTLYFYWVKSFNATNSSPFSLVASNRTFSYYPSTPVFISAMGAETNQIDLLWSKVGNATSYTLFRSIVNSTNNATSRAGFVLATTNFSDIGLSPATRYFYWLRAYNSKGSSPVFTRDLSHY